ncbi:DNA repair protein RecO [Roseococcus sp. SYP-B2431]|uniref:DNA repair protein RecO n=1 Tax=Roseococcus sp. SYP-B2431 TaxID=2496640 RepID=UPI00103ED5AB|nr:DNA repair protein RecO [Roseococcus sp. SYP-B2431]TCH96498.1 DNA repair protein RecO [Roseococcus sp. SYP-B2431]
MEWMAPAIVLSGRPHGETGVVVTLLTEAHGRHAGLAKGGASRAQAALWQPGNLIEARWVGRLADQLGAVSGEMVHAAAARAMDDPLALSILLAACAVAEGALPEREAHPACFHGLVRVIAALARGPEDALPLLVQWEAGLLAELGYGLDLTSCAATGATEGLVWVSPRSGRAVSEAAGAPYAGRLLALPAFLRDDTKPSYVQEWLAGLRLTGFFLSRDAFGLQHRPLPHARVMLQDRLTTTTDSTTTESSENA